MPYNRSPTSEKECLLSRPNCTAQNYKRTKAVIENHPNQPGLQIYRTICLQRVALHDQKIRSHKFEGRESYQLVQDPAQIRTVGNFYSTAYRTVALPTSLLGKIQSSESCAGTQSGNNSRTGLARQYAHICHILQNGN